ncbi:MAG: 6-carboxytetrahydropterin synthase, partial [Ignavibacteria bacterium]|nr:6-carboxytetrahydropterin synthase [Ignavibacteria bacterium]
EVEGELDKNGMVIDYYDVEKIVNPIIEKLDHAFMVNKDDKITIEFLEKLNSKKVIVDFKSTAENICTFLLNQIKDGVLPANIKLLTVRVSETDEDYAEERIIL